ncbi:hypothetical protein BU26DRAFT_604902 [Trematosphaeria pertusa]|uniref:Uncharacterized protein n=1 Tax=Trematosphaeria pertusa TaxID=390896 RepID=A0A6A6IEG4_9PLEO|nr:uncharacterized protein BU26DRAFT_604902 [Trematosphaeria pertusa]KAF2248964.1 hypothetical protein BU26DRAFT_604902 [Trematosphaeria pertusa]
MSSHVSDMVSATPAAQATPVSPPNVAAQDSSAVQATPVVQPTVAVQPPVVQTTPAGQTSTKLTHERLINKLMIQYEKVAETYPDEKDQERVKALQAVIQEAIDDTKAVMDSGEYVSPGQMKHDVDYQIQKVHKRFDLHAKLVKFVRDHRRKNMIEEYTPENAGNAHTTPGPSEAAAAQQSQAVFQSPGVEAASILESMRTSKPASKPAAKKSAAKTSHIIKRSIPAAAPATRQPATTQQATTQPALSSKAKGKQRAVEPSSPISPTNNKRKRSGDDNTAAAPTTPPKRSKYAGFLSVPVIDTTKTAEQVFFDGVEYAVQNYLVQMNGMANEMTRTFAHSGDFQKYVMHGLGLGIRDGEVVNVATYGQDAGGE